MRFGVYIKRQNNLFMKLLAKIYYYLALFTKGGMNRLASFFYKYLMISCGKNVRFSAITSDFTYRNLSIGNDVYVGPNALFVATESRITIGNKVLFGPGVTIIGGDHRMYDLGHFMHDITDKQPGDDLDIHIDDDVWIAANVTILKGVTIGRGAVIAAGSLVIKDVTPYSIEGGVPSRKLKYRFTIEEILEHEALLYSVGDRFTKEQLYILRKIER